MSFDEVRQEASPTVPVNFGIHHINLKYSPSSFFVRQTPPYGTTNSLLYSVCPCREKYPFRKGSPLLTYFKENCKGFRVDPLGLYSINYLLIVLLANLKDKGLTSKRSNGSIYCDKELINIEGRKHIHVSSLRRFIKQHLVQSEGYSPSERYPFWCSIENGNFINSVLKGSPCVYKKQCCPWS